MSNAARRALYNRIVSGTAIDGYLGTPAAGYTHAVYHNQAPANAEFPFIVFSRSSGVPTDTFHRPGALETDVWLVKAVDKNTTADRAEAAATRVQALLNGTWGTATAPQPPTISGAGTALYLQRESDVEYAEVTEGVTFHHCGALYRLIFEPS